MIIIRNFNEAYCMYQQALLPLRLLQEQAVVMLGICDQPTDVLSITNQHIQWLTQQPESETSYIDLVGGDMHICEHANDLMQIQGCDVASVIGKV